MAGLQKKTAAFQGKTAGMDRERLIESFRFSPNRENALSFCLAHFRT
jgi:hypothetical protein